MSDETSNVTLEVTAEGSLDLSVPTEGDNRALTPVELLVVGFFLRSSNDPQFVEELLQWTAENYESYLSKGEEEAAE